MSEANKDKIVEVSFLESDIPKELSGARVGDEYVRVHVSKDDISQFPSIAALTKDGDKINSVWLIISKQPGKLLSEGQELYARVRVSKYTGGFAIAATVALGVVVAVKVIKRSQDEH